MPFARSLLGVLSAGVTAAVLGRRAHPRRCRNRLGLRIASPRGSTGDVVVSEHDVVETASPAKRRVVLRQLAQKLHWSAENAHARAGDRYQNRQADTAARGEFHTTKSPSARTRFWHATADGRAGEQAAAGASAASKNRI